MFKKLILMVIAGSMFFLVTACGNRPVPLKDFKQEITVSNPASTLKANETMPLSVNVKNISTETWFKSAKTYHVHLAYSWMTNVEGKLSYKNGGYLPNDLAPGESATINAVIKAPEKAGNYTLRLTMVQEDVEYFDKKGAKPLDLHITVN